ncbi:hypothetical protein [Streptacidiphilus sp. PAMC 29251]
MTMLSPAAVLPPADPAPTPASTTTTLAQQIETVRAALPPASFTCRYGSTFCGLGQNPHEPCSSGWIKVTAPGEQHPVTCLELVIESYEENKPPILALAADGNNAVEVTPAQARAVVASVLDHLPRMLTMIDQYDAIIAEVSP